MPNEIKEAPTACPVCKDDNLSYDGPEIDGNEASQVVRCSKGHKWNEVYTFDRIVMIEG
jgi:hypothetical protein